MSRPASRSSQRGIGCGFLFALAFLVLSIPGFRIGCAVWKAKQVEQTLIDTMGPAATFTPAPSGAVSAERMEAFVRVRRRVFEQCPGIQGHLVDISRLGELEEDSEVPPTELAKEGLGGLRRLLGFGSDFLRFMEVRNGALLAEGMGLGEYMYIYVLAYRDQLRLEHESRFAGLEDAYVGVRARNELTQILQNQLHALETGETGPGQEAWVAEVRAQVAHLRAGENPLPWESGLPPSIAVSIAPYTDSLDSLYCSGMAKIELSQKNKGLELRN